MHSIVGLCGRDHDSAPPSTRDPKRTFVLVENPSLLIYATAQTLLADFAPQTRFGVVTMIKTLLCDVLGIDAPIILAAMGTCTSAEFAAAVSNEGGLGGLGSLFRSTAAVKRDIDMAKRTSGVSMTRAIRAKAAPALKISV